MKEFFAMGGYAFYVWTSYILALIVFVLNLVGPYMQRRKILSDIARRMRRETRLQSRNTSSDADGKSER